MFPALFAIQYFPHCSRSRNRFESCASCSMDSSILNQVNTTAVANTLTPELEAETQWRAENSGRIKMREYQIVVGVLFGTATLTCAGRILIRLYTRRKLFLDDIFLIFGFLSLIGGTVLLKQVPVFYLVLATLQGDFWATVLSFKNINDVIKQWDYIYAYFVFLWTSIYAVKGCYFAFFAQFRRTMTRTFNWYYWIAVGFSVVCWIWSCVALTIACPYFGDDALKCFPDLPISKRIVRLLFWLYPILDGISDLMIISIPILILKQSQLRLITKIGLCAFLCLSIFMIACSITRAAGSYHKGALDYVWQLFWLHTEACIGVSMGSITVYRSTLIGSNEVSDRLQSYLNRIFGRDLESGDVTTVSPNGERTRRRRRFLGTIKLPGATLTGLRTKFGPSKEQGKSLSTGNSTNFTVNSDMGLLEADYHAYIKTSAPTSTPTSPPMQQRSSFITALPQIQPAETPREHPNEKKVGFGKFF